MFIYRPEDLRKSNFTTDFKNIFQANPKDSRITFPKHSYFVDFEHVFVYWGTLATTQSNSEKQPYLHVQEFDEVPSY